MRVLAVDTTTERESVAVVSQGRVLGESRLVCADGHSRRLVPSIAFLLGGLGLAAADVEAYAVTTGPGSFTGLRVGLSTVQGLALASRRPCLGMAALDVLAARIAGSGPWLVALMDAYRGEVFAARYDAEAKLVGERVVVPPESYLRGLPPQCAFVGDAVAPRRPLIESICEQPRFPDRSLFLAGTLGRLAEVRLAAGEGAPPQGLRPLYIREAQVRLPAP